MSLELIVRPEAENDLSQARRWYEQQLRGLGRDFLDEVAATFERIESNPEAYAKIRGRLRRALVRRFPFGVFYLLEREQIIILAVLRASRDPRLWKSRVRTGR